jgi:hypothetical protein
VDSDRARQPPVEGRGRQGPEVHGPRPARHRGGGQPLRRPLRRRGGPGLDRGPFRVAGPGAQDRDALHQGRRGPGRGSTWTRPSSARHGARGALPRRDGARGRVRLCGPDWVAGEVLDILGARPVDAVHNHHNYAWRERPRRPGPAGWCARARPRPIPASGASSAAPWGTTR